MLENQGLPTADRLLELSAAMAGQTVLMAADLVADRYITGSPKRVSREAPVLILRFEEESWALGGGANAVANVRALGGEPLVLGVLGDDQAGQILRERFETLGVSTAGLHTQAGYATPTKTRLMAGDHHSVKQQVARYDIEGQVDFDSAVSEHFNDALSRWSGRATVAVMSDYGYGAVTPGLMSAARQALGEQGTVLCDSRYQLESFAGLNGATPNQEEVEALTSSEIDNDDQVLVESGRDLLGRLSADFLLMTRGSLGMVLFQTASLTRIPVHGTQQVADVTGAGDTVIGTLALARAAGGSPLEASLLANYAAGVVVRKPGTAVPTLAELHRAIESDPVPLEQATREPF
jgi:rfaE bifunctional protein kinase chain/domain